MTEKHIPADESVAVEERAAGVPAVNEQEPAAAAPAEETVLPAAGEVLVEDAVVAAAVAAPSRKRRRRFWPWLCVYAVLLSAVAAFGLHRLYKGLQAYESETPNSTLTQFLTWIETENYEAMYACADFEETVLNTKEEYLRYLKRVYGGAEGELSVRETDGGADKRTYTVYAGETALSDITLLKNPQWGETPWTAYTELNPLPAVSIVAEADTRLSVNGTQLALLNLPAEAVQETELAGTTQTEALPVIQRYTLSGLLNPPEITGLTLSGESCVVQAVSDTLYRVLQPENPALQAAHEQLAKEVAAEYAAFTARRFSQKNLKKRLFKPGNLYQSVSEFTAFLTPTPTAYTCGDIAVSDYSRLSTQDFSCTVRFTPTYVQNGKTVTGEPVSYRLTFLAVEDEWKLLSLTPAA